MTLLGRVRSAADRHRTTFVFAGVAAAITLAGVTVWHAMPTAVAQPPAVAPGRDVELRAEGNTTLYAEWRAPNLGSTVQKVTGGSWSTVLHDVPDGTQIRMIVKRLWVAGEFEPAQIRGTCAILIGGSPIRNAHYETAPGTTSEAMCYATVGQAG